MDRILLSAATGQLDWNWILDLGLVQLYHFQLQTDQIRAKNLYFSRVIKYSQVPEVTSAAETNGDSRPRLGIGMDASVTPIPDMPGTSLAQTTDFFYPLVDDPYLQVVT